MRKYEKKVPGPINQIVDFRDNELDIIMGLAEKLPHVVLLYQF
jgi:hypothetical protein